jgi:hypothetical protein
VVGATDYLMGIAAREKLVGMSAVCRFPLAVYVLPALPTEFIDDRHAVDHLDRGGRTPRLVHYPDGLRRPPRAFQAPGQRGAESPEAPTSCFIKPGLLVYEFELVFNQSSAS